MMAITRLSKFTFAVVLFFSLLSRKVNGLSMPSRSELEALDASIAGNVLFPDAPSFAMEDQAWFLANDELVSSAIIFANNEQDVITIVDFLNNYDGIDFRLRSSGSSFGGYSKCNQCITVNLERLQGIRYIQSEDDNDDVYASVAAGTQMSALIASFFTNAYQVKIPHTWCPNVTVSGYYGSGGFHDQFRTQGFATDSIVAARVVLSDGSVVFVYDEDIDEEVAVSMLFDEPLIIPSEIKEEEDDERGLLWAIRGSGSGSFGVITRFYMKATPLPPQNQLLFSASAFRFERETAVDVLRSCQNANDMTNGRGEDYLVDCNVVPVNLSDPLVLNFFPNGWAIDINVRYIGSNFAEALQLVKGIINFNNNTRSAYVEEASLTQPNIPYQAIGQLLSNGVGIATRSPATNDNRLFFPGDDVERLLESLVEWHWNTFVVPNTLLTTLFGAVIQIDFWGNTLRDQDSDAERTASPNRNAIGMITLQVGTLIEQLYPSFAALAVQTLTAAIDNVFEPLIGNQTYLGYRSRSQSDIENYFGAGLGLNNEEILSALQAVKARYDPINLFRIANVSVPLSSSTLNTTGISEDSSDESSSDESSSDESS